jgi:hypothetical protein
MSDGAWSFNARTLFIGVGLAFTASGCLIVGADEIGEGEIAVDGDGDGDPAGESVVDCSSVSISAWCTPPNVMLLVEASGSMVWNLWDHDLDPDTPDETRWKTLYRVLTAVLKEFGPVMRSGFQRFPSAEATPIYGSPACPVSPTPEVGVAFNNGAVILAAIPGPDEVVQGAVPATAGMISVTNHLSTQPKVFPRYVVLISDGAANCGESAETAYELMEVYDDTWPATVEAARLEHDITTFVVGIEIPNEHAPDQIDGMPYVNPYEALNDVAVAGGAPRPGDEKFYNSTNEQELLSAVAGILDQITRCTIDLSTTEAGAPDPTQIPFVEFAANGVKVPKVDDCESQDGWTWLEDGVVVTFCGSYGQNFKSGDMAFEGTYGCPPND